MLIRKFEPSDSNEVVTLWKSCNLVVAWNDPLKDIKRKLDDGAELFLVGELESTIVASIMGSYNGHRGWINYLAVSPEHRRCGYGQKIMKVLEKRLLDLGCPKINLQIRASNADVIAFYESLGYSDDHVLSLGKRLIPD